MKGAIDDALADSRGQKPGIARLYSGSFLAGELDLVKCLMGDSSGRLES
jgi:hypothetical protein